MRKVTQHFDELYQGVAFLTLMGSPNAQRDIKNNRSDRNMFILRDICHTLLYRLGSPMAMSLTIPGQPRVSVSLRDEASAYQYMLSNMDPILLLNRYVEGRQYQDYLQGLRGLQSHQFEKQHKEYLTFADTIFYYIASLDKNARLEKQTRNNAVYTRYRQSLCSANSPRYNEVYSEVLDYSKEFSL